MSDTTETDSAFQKGMSCKEVFEFAQRLERERDQAREALREAIQFRDTTLNGYDLDAWLKAAGLKP
jgi:uncharacterized protein YllA (UPF0747 family)